MKHGLYSQRGVWVFLCGIFPQRRCLWRSGRDGNQTSARSISAGGGQRGANTESSASGFLDCVEASRVTLKGLCYLESTSAVKESDSGSWRTLHPDRGWFTWGRGRSYAKSVFLLSDIGGTAPRGALLNCADGGAALTAARRSDKTPQGVVARFIKCLLQTSLLLLKQSMMGIILIKYLIIVSS